MTANEQLFYSGGVIILGIILLNCSGMSTAKQPLFHSPLANTEWSAASKDSLRSPHSSGDKAKQKIDAEDLRGKMIAFANALLEEAPNNGSHGYGAEDLEAAFREAGLDIQWQAEQGLARLVERAEKSSAFYASASPRPGDIALFHNEWDANANGEADDWLTGCGIVTSGAGPHFTAVVRTDHVPRRAVISPDGPMRRIADGQLVNSFLRVPKKSDPRDAEYLAGQLYAGYIDIEELAKNPWRQQ